MEKKKFVDQRTIMKKYNSIDTAVKDNKELLNVSEGVYGVSIYCHEFVISKEVMRSLQKHGNFVIGTGLRNWYRIT